MRYFFDYYNFVYDKYEDCIISLSKEKEKSKLIITQDGLKFATQFEVVIQTIKGWLGFENKTDIVKVNSELLKMLHYGQTHHFMGSEEVVKAVNSLVDHLKTKNRKVSQAVLKCVAAINRDASTEEKRKNQLREMQDAIKSYHTRHEIRLQDAFWTRKMQQKIRRQDFIYPPTYFGDTYTQLGQKARNNRDHLSARTYYKKAALVVEDFKLKSFFWEIENFCQISNSLSDIDFLKEMVEIALKNNLFDSAIIIYISILRVSPKEKNYLFLANLYLEAGQYENCLEILEKNFISFENSLDIRKQLAESFELSKKNSIIINLKKAERLIRGVDISTRVRIVYKLAQLIDWKPPKQSFLNIFCKNKEDGNKKEDINKIVIIIESLLEELSSKSLDLIDSNGIDYLVEIGRLIKSSCPQQAYECFSFVHRNFPEKNLEDFFNLSVQLKKYDEIWTINPERCEQHAVEIVEFYCKNAKFEKAYEVILKFPEKKYLSSNLNQVVDFFKNLAQEKYKLGWKSQEEKKYEDSLTFYQQALEFSQKAFDVLPSTENKDLVSQFHRKIGDACAGLNDLNSARKSYQKSLEMEMIFDSYLRSSFLKLAKKYLKEAEKHIEICLEGNDVYDHSSREKHQTSPPVIKAKDESLKALQESINLLQSIINSPSRKQIDDNVLKEMKKLLAKLNYKQGAILHYFEIPGKLESFKSALENNPGNLYYHLRLYDIYKMEENESEAEKAWKKIDKISGKNPKENFSTTWLHYCDEQYLKEKVYTKELDIHA